MAPEVILSMENDGLNLAVDADRLYVRCKRTMHSYALKDMVQTAHAVIFKKDGKARGFSFFENGIFLTDFCDLYMLDKDSFQVSGVYRIGQDASSDLGVVRFGGSNAYLAMRNGGMAVMDVDTRAVSLHQPDDVSFWDFCITKDRIYAGTVRGELLEIDAQTVQVLRRVSLGKKNIYSVVPRGRRLYTVSQDASIKAVDMDALAVAAQAKKAVCGMARILGCYRDDLLVADSGKVSVWRADTLQHRDTFDFPTGDYNKGIVLAEDTLYGSDGHHIYRMALG